MAKVTSLKINFTSFFNLEKVFFSWISSTSNTSDLKNVLYLHDHDQNARAISYCQKLISPTNYIKFNIFSLVIIDRDLAFKWHSQYSLLLLALHEIMQKWVERNGRFLKNHRHEQNVSVFHAESCWESCVNHLSQSDEPSAFLIRPPISYYRTYEELEYTVSWKTYVLIKKVICSSLHK